MYTRHRFNWIKPFPVSVDFYFLLSRIENIDVKLVFTPGSPGSRVVRIVLDELQIEYESVVTDAGASPDFTPTLQVPCLITDKLTLWEAPLIVEYLLLTAEGVNNPKESHLPLANSLYRPSRKWEDKLVLASVQTFGTSVATISQMRWAGVRHQDNDFLTRCGERINHLLDWYEMKIEGTPVGLFKSSIAMQDLLLVCWLDFLDHRPLEIEWRKPGRTNLTTLFDQLTSRQSVINNPIEWWEP